MFLHFLGRGAGFADEHTSAYFVTENQGFFLIDCPTSTFMKVKHFDLSKYNNFYVIITHTHGDHVGGLGLWIQYCFFVLQKTVTILAPSKEVKDDIETLLTIEGNETSWYDLDLINPNAYSDIDLDDPSVYIEPILTKHSPQLKGKCFGYYIEVCYTESNENNFFIYTGDTSTLKPFDKNLDYCSEIYVDASVYYGQTHLKLEDVLPDLIRLTERGIKVYLMHLDDVDAAQRIIADIPNIEIVKLS